MNGDYLKFDYSHKLLTISHIIQIPWHTVAVMAVSFAWNKQIQKDRKDIKQYQKLQNAVRE